MERNCPRCDEPVFDSSEVCQVCGYVLERVPSRSYSNKPSEDELLQLIEKGLTSCIISFFRKSNEFTFLTVEKFEKLGMIGGYYRQQINEFFIFKSQNHPNIRSLRQHVIFDLKDFDHFITGNYVKVYYLRDEMNNSDILELKTYKFNV